MDTINYGPLAPLVGTWRGDKGLDVAPEPDGTEENPYEETLVFEAIGDVTNAERQVLAVLHYRQIVRRKSSSEVFHDQTGYWTFDAATGTVAHSLSIPRAVTLLAGGVHDGTQSTDGGVTLTVAAARGDADWSIAQSPFMRDNASTEAFEQTMTVTGDRLHYRQTTTLEIYGRRVAHTDENTLTRAG